MILKPMAVTAKMPVTMPTATASPPSDSVYRERMPCDICNPRYWKMPATQQKMKGRFQTVVGTQPFSFGSVVSAIDSASFGSTDVDSFSLTTSPRFLSA